MKLLRVTIDGKYKGLCNQEFDFSLSKGNVIAFIGLNGSGKSQLLELICEAFSLIERTQRDDFRVRSEFPFTVIIEYEILAFQEQEVPVTYRITIEPERGVSCQYLNDDEWCWLALEDLLLPEHIVGYSSGLNENLQRSFMKNAVQYIDTTNIKASWTKRLETINEFRESIGIEITTEDLERLDDEIDRAYLYYSKRNPGIFKSLDSVEYRVSEDSEIGTRPTQLSIMKFLDYDCNSLLMACLGIIDQSEMNSLFGEQTSYNRVCNFTVKYDLRKCIYDVGAIRDIKQLISIVGKSSVTSLSGKTSDELYNQYELDYLSAIINIDLSDDSIKGRLREAYFNSPLIIFEKLYRIQTLGAKNWLTEAKKRLRNDSFFSHVKKPLKTRLPLSIENLHLSNADGQIIEFDDLSDGEAQLLQILSAARIFRDNNTLFILDEPETHFNPSWRTCFHQNLHNAIETDRPDQANKNNQVFLSTHSPFMISSLKKEDVFYFDRDEDENITMEPVPSQTYGASFEVLIKQYFKLRSLISQTVIDEVKSHLPENNDPESLARARTWLEENVGDSMEKAYLLRKLQG